MVQYNGAWYHYLSNLQGDIVGIVDPNGDKVVEYKYDAWGRPLSKTGSMAGTLGTLNPFRYRGYVYDEETGLYYLRSRYYRPEWGRFICSDTVLGSVGGLISHNLYAYCWNNPGNMSDSIGRWPQWLTGALEVVGGLIQAAVGAALIVSAPVTGGLGAAVGTYLLVDGAATVAAGTAMIINDVAGTTLHEENLVKTGMQALGQAIGGDSGASVGGTVYMYVDMAADAYVTALSFKSISDALFYAGKITRKVPASHLVGNPKDPFVYGEPKQGRVVEYINSIQSTGEYEVIDVLLRPNGFYQIAGGHHRTQALKSLGYKSIRVRISK